MTTAKRNMMFPTLVIGIGITLLLLAIDVLPEAVGDLMERSWSILLVIFGLNLLLNNRIRFGNWIAVAISAVMLGVLIFVAYDAQANEKRTDYVEILEPIPLGDHIQGVKVFVESQNATVIFQPTTNRERVIAAHFTGSTESKVNISVVEDEAGYVNVTIIEERSSTIPKLDQVGRGELIVNLPVGVPIVSPNANEPGLVFVNQEGLATLDFQALDIPRFDIRNEVGDIDLYMPIQGIVIGDVNIGEGSLLIVARPEIPLRVGNAPPSENIEINENVYRKGIEGDRLVVESVTNSGSYQFNLNVNIPSGLLTIKSPEEIANQ